MAKGRSFSAKLAHQATGFGKVICPNCESEVKKVKLIRSKNSKANSWSPKYEISSICKCNETKILK